MEPATRAEEPIEENSKLESQFVLRLPQKVSDSIKKVLAKKPKKIKKYMKIDMNPETRLGLLIFNKHTVPLKLMDLPCIIESMKTIDNKWFFKTADIHQMFLAYDPNEVKEVNEKKKGKEFVWPHGVTPPMKNVSKNRFRKTMKNKQPLDSPEIEKEVKWLLKVDNEAVCVRWELVDDDKYQKVETLDSDVVIDEKDVFGEMTDSLTEDEYENFGQDYQDEVEETNDLYPNVNYSP